MHILLADDQELVRDAIGGFIKMVTGYSVDGAPDLNSALDAISENGPYDLVLLDYQMPGMSGLRGLGQVIAAQQGKPVVLLSGNLPASVVEEAFLNGASGYFPKSMPANSLIQALKLTLAGEKYAPPQMMMTAQGTMPSTALPALSQREATVLRHVCSGMTNVEIAGALGVHETTVKFHVKSICTKVDARNRTQATIIARNAGFF